MIKAESYINTKDDGMAKISIRVVTSITDDMADLGVRVFKAELVSIFKQLDTIDPDILMDALEIYTEDIKNDKTDFNND